MRNRNPLNTELKYIKKDMIVRDKEIQSLREHTETLMQDTLNPAKIPPVASTEANTSATEPRSHKHP